MKHTKPTLKVDVAILGAGTAGLSARRAAKAAGASVVMIDPGPFGTTCARVGCMPSKLLIAAAESAHHASLAGTFGAGDVNALHPLLHEAADDGKLAGTNAANYPQVHATLRRTPLAIVFSDPQIAIVGRGHRDLANCEAVAGSVDYSDQGRARVHAVNAGLARIYADKTNGQLLGAELFGPRAEHLSHLLAWAVQQRMTVDEALAMPFYHPAFEEGVRTALRDLAAKLRTGDAIKCAVSEHGAGA